MGSFGDSRRRGFATAGILDGTARVAFRPGLTARRRGQALPREGFRQMDRPEETGI